MSDNSCSGCGPEAQKAGIHDHAPSPTLRSTHDRVIMRPIRQTKTAGARGAPVHVPESAKERLCLVRILGTGPLCKSGVKTGDVAVFLVDPTTVDPTKEFVFGEIDWDGETLWIAPEGVLGPIVDNPETLLATMQEGVSTEVTAQMRAEEEEAERRPPLVVARPGPRRGN